MLLVIGGTEKNSGPVEGRFDIITDTKLIKLIFSL